MPDPEWWAKQNRGPWTSGKTANITCGMGEVQATPLQMAAVAAAIANGGKIWNPRIISRTLVKGAWQAAPVELRHDLVAESISQETIDVLRNAMRAVVSSDKGGTGRAAESTITAVSGKTGTGQNWRVDQSTNKKLSENHTQFIGFAPFEAPRYTFSITVANGKSGGSVCAPIARRIMESIELLNRGEYVVELKSQHPAPGHFNYIESVVYPQAIR